MILTFRPLKQRPPGWDKRPKNWSPFRSNYLNTLDLLERELSQLRATNIILQVDATPGQIRQDGQLRADAKVRDPGVILSFDTKAHGTLSYPCRAFDGSYGDPGWQANLRAIALGLEALRKVERYGIAERGQQYAGWAELPPGIPLGPTMSVAAAASVVAEACGDGSDGGDLLVGFTLPTPDAVERAYKLAAKRLHPDVGGDHEQFLRLKEAVEVLRSAS